MANIRIQISLALMAFGGLAWAQSQVPACQARALRTVDEARRQALVGSGEQARKLLEQADRECGTSQAVLSRIATVYRQLGDSVNASIYDRNADLAGGNAPQGPPEPRPKPPVKSFVRDKFALIVGVGKFQNPSVPTLKYAAKDAQDFASTLFDPQVGRFYRDNVIVLTEENATVKSVKSALATIAAKATPEDLVVLYFSTHGSSPAMDRSKIGSGYLVLHDTDPADLYATAYGMDELANFIRQRLRADRIVTFLDTCYSGDTTRILAQANGSKALQVDALSEEAIGQVAQGRGSVVITSSTNRELSWMSEEQRNSFFTLYLLESLRSRQGLGTIRELYTDLQRRIPPAVREYTVKHGLGEPGKGAAQNPVIYPISEIPDIVIGTPIQ